MKNNATRALNWNAATLLSLLCITAAPAWAQFYWDANSDVVGSGATPNGTWGVDNFWTSDSLGNTATFGWTDNTPAIFSAGSDATGEYAVTVSGTKLTPSLTVEDGHLTLSGSAINIGGGSVTVAPGAKLSIPHFVGALTQSILGTAGATINLDGSTLRSVSNAAGLTFLDPDFTINLGASGGILETTNTGTASNIFTGDIRGIGNTLIKTGTGEFRYQGAKMANANFQRLVVLQGLYRLGFVTGQTWETGFGAVPDTFLADAITLSGGSIGTSWFAVDNVLHPNRGITIGAGGGTLISAFTVQGAITGAGPLTITAGGGQLNGVNTFTGGITITTGTTSIGANGGMLAQTVAGAGSLTVNGVVTGAATLAKTSTGTLTLNGSNDYTGQTVVSAGILNVGHANALGSPLANTQINIGAELRIDGATKIFTIAEPLEIAGGGAGGGGAITIQNSANATFSGPVTLAGDTTVSVASGATGNFTNPVAFTSSGNFTLTLQGDAGSGFITGAITVGSGGLNKLQGGTWTLSGANSYTGITTVGAGMLQFGKQVSLYDGVPADWTAANIVVASGATLAFNVGGAGEFTPAQVNSLAALGTATGGFLSGSAIGIDTTNADNGQVTQGALANPNGGANTLGLTKLGAGTLLLSATNTYTGITTVLAGILSELPGASIADASPLTVNGPTAEFALGANHSDTVGTVTLQGGGRITGTGTSTLTVAAGTFALQNGSVSAILAGDAIPLNKTTPDTVTLSGANTYTGPTTISAGTLSVSKIVVTGGSSNLGNATTALVLGSATTAGALSYTGSTATFTRGFDIQAGGGRIDVLDADQTLTIANGNITGAGSVAFGGGGDVVIATNIQVGAGGLTKDGNGTLTLEGVNTYPGATTLTAGALLVKGSILNTSVVNVSGILGGTGTLVPGNDGSINLLAGGKISPGTSIGTLTASLSGSGKFDLTAGITTNLAALEFELASVFSSDLIVVSGGPLEIGAGQLGLEDFSFVLLGGFDGGDYLLFDGNVPISGTLGANFSGTVGGFPAELRIQDGNDLVLHVVPEPGTAAILLAGLGAFLPLRRRSL